jgi:hypothetical protein
MPGPKMIWQFGELGYDYSINYNPTTGKEDDGARTDKKPYPENYLDNENRKSLYDFYSKLCKLRRTNEAMTNGTAKIDASSLMKIIYRKSEKANLIFAVNFNTDNTNARIAFPKGGTWYEIISGEKLEVSNQTVNYPMTPGQTAIFSDNEDDVETATADIMPKSEINLTVYPNPCSEFITIDTKEKIQDISILNISGQKVKTLETNQNKFDISDLTSGIYFVIVKTEKNQAVKKLVKK